MRLDARDVLDPDAETRRPFRARVLGSFRPTGPNATDDYVFVSCSDGEELEVLPGLPVQLERRGAQLRLRREGKVLRLEWLPDPEELALLLEENDSPSVRRRRFRERYLASFREAAGLGAAAVIASKLQDGESE
jgi:hypothetical protein